MTNNPKPQPTTALQSIEQIISDQTLTRVEEFWPGHSKQLRLIVGRLRRENKHLANWKTQEILGFLMDCAELQLSPSKNLGYIYPVPIDGQIVPIIGYRGMIQIARRNPNIVTIDSDLVFEKDIFNYSKTNRGIEYEYTRQTKGEERREENVTCAYVYLAYSGGGQDIQVLDRDEILKCRNSSKSYSSSFSPWKHHWEAMYQKCPIRKLFKFMAHAPQMQRALEIDSDDFMKPDDKKVIEAQALENEVNAKLEAASEREK